MCICRMHLYASWLLTSPHSWHLASLLDWFHTCFRMWSRRGIPKAFWRSISFPSVNHGYMCNLETFPGSFVSAGSVQLVGSALGFPAFFPSVFLLFSPVSLVALVFDDILFSFHGYWFCSTSVSCLVVAFLLYILPFVCILSLMVIVFDVVCINKTHWHTLSMWTDSSNNKEMKGLDIYST